MNESSKTYVAGGVLDSLFKLLFKGLDNIFNAAVEYENDMGKLKQVSNIKVKDSNGNEGIVKIKLSPVKDKDSVYYVEVVSDIDGFNAEGVDRTTMKIDKTGQEDFKKLIAKLLSDNKLMQIKEEGEGLHVINCYDEDEYIKWKEEDGPEPKIIKVEVIQRTSSKKGYVDISLECKDKELKYDDHAVSSDDLDGIKEGEVRELIDKILEDSKLMRTTEADEEYGFDENKKSEDQSDTNEDELEEEDEDELEEEDKNQPIASKHIDVSLSYVKSSDEVELHAIYANYDVNRAMQAFDEIINNDEFVDMLTEDPQSFRITDEGDDFDIMPIDIVDTTSAANDIYTAITGLIGLLEAYSIDLDQQQQTEANNLISALSKAQIMFQSEGEAK